MTRMSNNVVAGLGIGIAVALLVAFAGNRAAGMYVGTDAGTQVNDTYETVAAGSPPDASVWIVEGTVLVVDNPLTAPEGSNYMDLPRHTDTGAVRGQLHRRAQRQPPCRVDVVH